MPSVLRIGPRTAHEESPELCIASRLRSAILSHFAEEDGGSEKLNDGGDAGGNVMTISNKYFSADVALEFLSEEENGVSLGNEDGVVLVFDARGGSGGAPSDPSLSFESLTSVHDAAVASEQAGDLLRLCIGVSLDGPLPPPTGKAAEEEYSRRVLWCLDRGYEYVEANLSEDGLRAGHDERDKDGFARVAEAVGGTVWSGATMKPRKAAQLRRTFEDTEKGLQQPSTSAPASAEVSTTRGAREQRESDEKKKSAQKRHEVGNSSGASNATGDSRDGAEMHKKGEEILSVEPPESLLDEENPSDPSAFNGIDTVLQQAAAVRAASKSGELSDEERRKRAGDVAMMLAGLMGEMDSDDSDDEEERT